MSLNTLIHDTIAAQATAPGASALSIIRLAGPESLKIIKMLGVSKKLRPRYAYHFQLFHPDSEEILDDVILTWFKAPNSFTGDDLIEISCHGGYESPRRILSALLKAGARMAEAGEYTRRAFMAGKLDLLQVEAVADIIHSRSSRSMELAQRNLKGELSRKIMLIKQALIDLASSIELELDFSDQDIDKNPTAKIRESLASQLEGIRLLLSDFRSGKLRREGTTLALMGRPNAGKSSLLNAVLKDNRAIISDIPGTTRDTIEESFIHREYLFNIIDTAGLRKDGDELEQAGISKSYQSLQRADLLILIVDSSTDIVPDLEKELIKTVRIPRIILFNKKDLWDDPSRKQKFTALFPGEKYLFISTKDPNGVNDFLDELLNTLNEHYELLSEDVSINRLRHFENLDRSRLDLENALRALDAGEGTDLVSIDIRSAISHLDVLSGETRSEDILNNIFSQFCIGK